MYGYVVAVGQNKARRAVVVVSSEICTYWKMYLLFSLGDLYVLEMYLLFSRLSAETWRHNAHRVVSIPASIPSGEKPPHTAADSTYHHVLWSVDAIYLPTT